MSEVIEHELNKLAGKIVDVVRPNFGTQSDAWTGMLHNAGDGYPLQFQFIHVGGSILFQATDVTKVEQRTTTHERMSQAVVRLKGPQQYMTEPVHA